MRAKLTACWLTALRAKHIASLVTNKKSSLPDACTHADAGKPSIGVHRPIDPPAVRANFENRS
jgi:hypothetical protein